MVKNEWGNFYKNRLKLCILPIVLVMSKAKLLCEIKLLISHIVYNDWKVYQFHCCNRNFHKFAIGKSSLSHRVIKIKLDQSKHHDQRAKKKFLAELGLLPNE